jgi:hypothetical protein
MGRFEVAIAELQEDLEHKASVREQLRKRDLGHRDVDRSIDSIESAIRLLEAAQELTETDRRWLVDTIDEGIPVGAMRNRFCDLVHALPDAETEVKK